MQQSKGGARYRDTPFLTPSIASSSPPPPLATDGTRHGPGCAASIAARRTPPVMLGPAPPEPASVCQARPDETPAPEDMRSATARAPHAANRPRECLGREQSAAITTTRLQRTTPPSVAMHLRITMQGDWRGIRSSHRATAARGKAMSRRTGLPSYLAAMALRSGAMHPVHEVTAASQQIPV